MSETGKENKIQLELNKMRITTIYYLCNTVVQFWNYVTWQLRGYVYFVCELSTNNNVVQTYVRVYACGKLSVTQRGRLVTKVTKRKSLTRGTRTRTKVPVVCNFCRRPALVRSALVV